LWKRFIYATTFVLNSIFFFFNSKYYRQTYGTSMSSPLSLIIMDLVLQLLEMQTLNKLNFKPTFYFRYVDDIGLAAPLSSFNDLLEKFNSFYPRFKFIIKIGGYIINFLDLILIKRDEKLMFNWYQKPTFSGRFLNIHSHHSFFHNHKSNWQCCYIITSCIS